MSCQELPKLIGDTEEDKPSKIISGKLPGSFEQRTVVSDLYSICTRSRYSKSQPSQPY